MAAGDVTVLGTDLGRLVRSHRCVWGTVQLDGANPTPINLQRYLSSPTACFLSHVASASPGDDPMALTHAMNADGVTVDVYAWKTNGTDPTLIASTNNTAVVSFIAIGLPPVGY